MNSPVVCEAVAAQMLAALAMLRATIEAFPEPLWLLGKPNASWRIAYHTLCYLDFYLAADEHVFEPWEKHRGRTQRLDEEPDAQPYTRAELLVYCDLLSAGLGGRLRAVPLDAASGFSWLKMTRLEAHLYNLRHLAHHAGQLADRLRSEAGVGTSWVRRGE
ncbi:MAG TPA: DinB family protein [Acidobacteriaceae bacterium]